MPRKKFTVYPDFSIPGVGSVLWPLIFAPFLTLVPFLALFAHIWRSCAVQAWVSRISASLLVDALLTFSFGTIYWLYETLWSSPVRRLYDALFGRDWPPWTMDLLAVGLIFVLSLWRLYRAPKVRAAMEASQREDEYLVDVSEFIEDTRRLPPPSWAALYAIRRVRSEVNETDGSVEQAGTAAQSYLDEYEEISGELDESVRSRAMALAVGAFSRQPETIETAEAMLGVVARNALQDLNASIGAGIEIDQGTSRIEATQERLAELHADIWWDFWANLVAAALILATLKVAHCPKQWLPGRVVSEIWLRVAG